MSTGGRDYPDAFYVTGPHWHIVDGGEAVAQSIGRFYAFKCYRWMRVSEANDLGTFLGVPSPRDPVCGNCLRSLDQPDSGAPDELDGDMGEE